MNIKNDLQTHNEQPIDNKLAEFDLSEASNYFFKEYAGMRIKSK